MKRDVVAPVRKAKIPIPAAPINRDLRQVRGYFGIFAEIPQISAPHFRKKRAASYDQE